VKATRLPRCRFGCDDAVLFVAVPEGCFCFPNDRKQWLCLQHFVKLDAPYTVLADVVSLGWAEGSLPL
jgi:hypothetical protein